MTEVTRREFLATGLALTLPIQEKGFVVHEWGVLTVHPEAAWSCTGSTLPDFVTTWTAAVGKQIEDWKNTPMEVDKPVVYFYSDVKRTVEMRVDVPLGRPKCWWPPASAFGPAPATMNDTLESIKPEKGFLLWNVTVDPQARISRAVDSAHWWSTARETDAAPVQGDKFLFYEALTPFAPSLAVEGRRVRNVDAVEIPWVLGFDGAWLAAESIAPGAEVTLKPGGDLERRLRQAGLFDKEAAGLARIWKSDFEAEGLRVLYPMPEAKVQALLPMQIKPAPEKLVRLLLVRIEFLTEKMRREIDDLIAQLSHDELEMRDRATAALEKLGARAEGQLRASKSGDSETRARIALLLSRLKP